MQVKNFTMSNELIKFEFKKRPEEISYSEGKPLCLTNKFSFYHNKNRFRKELTRLQNLFKQKINDPLLASGIRDSYLKEDYTENLLIVIFTTNEIIKNATKIIKSYPNLLINAGCAVIKSTNEYMLLLAKDMKGLTRGIDYIEEILTQVLDDYLERKNFNDYIKIRPFELSVC